MLYFQGFEGLFGVRMVIFGLVEIGEMLDFSGFARSGYRSDFGDFGRVDGFDKFDFWSWGVDGTDTMVFVAKHLL